MKEMPNLLKKTAKRIALVSAAVFVIGFSWIIAASPCSDTGVYILLSSVALTALSGCILLVRALITRTLDSFWIAGAIAFLAFMQFGLSYFAALMLCRGV